MTEYLVKGIVGSYTLLCTPTEVIKDLASLCGGIVKGFVSVGQNGF